MRQTSLYGRQDSYVANIKGKGSPRIVTYLLLLYIYIYMYRVAHLNAPNFCIWETRFVYNRTFEFKSATRGLPFIFATYESCLPYTEPNFCMWRQDSYVANIKGKGIPRTCHIFERVILCKSDILYMGDATRMSHV